MGLDTTHDAWHGSYSIFNDWRRWLSQKSGFNLDEMEGFGGNKSWDTISTPLKPLLDHSDCDGVLSPTECKAIAASLSELLLSLTSSGNEKFNESFFVQKTKQFIDGCNLAFIKGEEIEFG